jgi:uracil-DNA glycosylase
MEALAGLKALLKQEAACKQRGTCSRLAIRELYFEPNHETLAHWANEYGFYKQGIDRRVVFIAESPSDRKGRADAPHFSVNGAKGWRCWDYTGQDKRFREFRVKNGLQNCLITNAVKCGVPLPSTPAHLTTKEAQCCSRFLRQELEAIRPIVVACMGDSAFRIFMEHTLPCLSFTPVPILLTHYSARGSLEGLKYASRDSLDQF